MGVTNLQAYNTVYNITELNIMIQQCMPGYHEQEEVTSEKFLTLLN